MRVLIAYGSKRGGTAGLAAMIEDEFLRHGVDVDVRDARSVADVRPFDAVVVAGALYANRWHRDARRFVRRQARDLRDRRVWLVSSGPLDDSASTGEIPPVRQVARLMAHVGAVGHQTFGGRLTSDAKGFPASSMARTHEGDWRDPTLVARWVDHIAADLTAGARSAEA